MKKNYGLEYIRYKKINYEIYTKIKYWFLTRGLFCEGLAHKSINKRLLRTSLDVDRDNFNYIKRLENKRINIPRGIKYIPTNMLIYELFPKTDLKYLLKGWKNLSSRCKYAGLGPNISERNIIDYIRSLNNNLDTYNILNFGMFKSPSFIDNISYFRCWIYNFSPSFCMFRFDVHFSNVFENEWHSLLYKPIKWVLNKDEIYINKKSQPSYTMDSISENKRQELSDDIKKIKWNFLKFIYKTLHISLLFFNKNIPSPTILMIDTDIRPKISSFKSHQNKGKRKLRSLNIKRVKEQEKYLDFDKITEINNSCKIDSHERVCLSFPYSNKGYSYVKYFYNSSKIHAGENVGCGRDVELYITSFSHSQFLDETGYLLCLGISNNIVKNYANKYLNDIRNIKLKWHEYRKILKIQFNYQNDTFYFNLIRKEKNWNKIAISYSRLLPKLKSKELLFIYTPELIINNVYISKHIDKIINNEKKFIKQKVTLIYKLYSKRNSGITLFLNVLAVIVTIIACISGFGSSIWHNIMVNIIHIFVFLYLYLRLFI